MADGLGAERHDFVSGDEVVTASNGRRIPACAHCGKAKNSQRHRAYKPMRGRHGRSGPVEIVRAGTPYTPPVTPPLSPPERAPLSPLIPLSALPPLEAPPEFVHAGALALALALDSVLDAVDQAFLTPPAIAYAVALRATLGVPRFRREEAPRLVAVEEVPEDRPKVAVTERLTAYQAPLDVDRVRGVPWAPRPKAKDRPEVSRARAATKGIRNDRMRALATRAIADGWVPRHMGDGHLRLEHAGQAPLTISTTANGAARGWHNVRSAARRRGIDVADL